MSVPRIAFLGLVASVLLAPVVAAPETATVTVELRHADLRQVVDQLLHGAGRNYAVIGELNGKVTARLAGVPLEQAIDVILANAGYEWEDEDGVLMIRERPKPEAVAPPKATVAPAKQTPPAEPAPAARGATAPDAPVGAPQVAYVLVPYYVPQAYPPQAYAQQYAGMPAPAFGGSVYAAGFGGGWNTFGSGASVWQPVAGGVTFSGMPTGGYGFGGTGGIALPGVVHY